MKEDGLELRYALLASIMFVAPAPVFAQTAPNASHAAPIDTVNNDHALYSSGQEAERAQDHSTAPTDQNESEIIVTARKRKESLLNVPIIESVVSKEQIQNIQAVDIKDLQTIAPGLKFGTASAAVGTLVSLRGVGTTISDPGVEQSVSLNIDGLPLGNGHAFQSGMFDIQQIEVLKGPQELFYGKGSPGGVISLRTADPTDTLEVIARLGYEFEAHTPRVEAIISGPVTNTLKLRLASMYSTSDGYFHNVAVPAPGTGALPPHRREPGARDYIIRGTALWNPSRQFNARLKINEVYDRTIGQSPSQILSCPEGPGFSPSGIPFMGGDNCKVERSLRLVYMDPASFPGIPNNGVPYVSIRQTYGTLELNYRPIHDISVTSVSGYYRLSESNLINSALSTSAGPPLASDNHVTNKQITEEIRANSDFSSPLNFTIGGFYQNADLAMDNLAHGNTAYKLPAVLIYGSSYMNIETYSLFGQLRWKVVPRLEVAGGLRWSDETRTLSVINRIGGTPVPVSLTVPRIHSANIGPEITLTYKPSDNVTAFGSLKKGYKSGSFSIATLNTTGHDSSFGDEKVKGAELGVKSRLFDRQLAINLAGYYYSYSGLQVGASIPTESGVIEVQTINAGSSHIYGLDIDTTFRPHAIKGLTLNGAVNWNHARYVTLNNVPCWGGQTIAAGCNRVLDTNTDLYTAQDLSGTSLVRAPAWQINGGATYEIPVGKGYLLTLFSNASYSSEYPTFLAVGRPNKDNYQSSFAKIDLSFSLSSPEKRWELSLIGKNITNKITPGTCGSANYANGLIFGGQVTGGTGSGVAKIDQVACQIDSGRQVWMRLTLRAF